MAGACQAFYARERSLILGGPDDEPELYDLAADPGERRNAYTELGDDGQALCERALSFLERVGTPEEYIAPRRKALDRWWSWSGADPPVPVGRKQITRASQTTSPSRSLK